jgi:hypothetical protein
MLYALSRYMHRTHTDCKDAFIHLSVCLSIIYSVLYALSRYMHRTHTDCTDAFIHLSVCLSIIYSVLFRPVLNIIRLLRCLTVFLAFFQFVFALFNGFLALFLV